MSNASPPNTSMEDPADAVEALWARSGEVPDLRAFLADHPHWLPSELRAALLVDQQFRSRTPQPWSAEEYAALAPTLVADDEFTLDLIFGEFRGRSRQGQPPNLQELSGRFPHLQQQLERQLEIALWFEDASGLLAVIAIQSSALHDQKEEIRAVREQADEYRQAIEAAKKETKRLQAEAAANRSRARDEQGTN